MDSLRKENAELKEENSTLSDDNVSLTDKNNKLTEENNKLNTSNNANNEIISKANQKANESLENFGVKYERSETLESKIDKIKKVSEEIKGVMMT